MPTISFPLLKSLVCGLGPWMRRERMTGEAMSQRINGFGSRVRSRIVSGSTTSTAEMLRTAEVNSAGLFGTVGTRAKVKATSSASKGVPSWKRAAVLSFTSQVRSSSGRMLRVQARLELRLGVQLEQRLEHHPGDLVVVLRVVVVRVERAGRRLRADGEHALRRRPERWRAGRP